MSKLWELQQFDKRTFRTELQRIPEYDSKRPKRPGSHLPSLQKPSNKTKQKSVHPYEPSIVDDKLKKILRDRRSKSNQNLPSETDSMLLTFMRPEELPELVAPPSTSKHSNLTKILSNRNGYIDGYFSSIRELRENIRGRSMEPPRLFDPVAVGKWLVRGELQTNTLVLKAFDEQNDRHLIKKYPWTRKLAQKIEQNYQCWVTSKFSQD